MVFSLLKYNYIHKFLPLCSKGYHSQDGDFTLLIRIYSDYVELCSKLKSSIFPLIIISILLIIFVFPIHPLHLPFLNPNLCSLLVETFIDSCLKKNKSIYHYSQGNKGCLPLEFQGPILDPIQFPPSHLQLPPRKSGKFSMSTWKNNMVNDYKF